MDFLLLIFCVISIARADITDSAALILGGFHVDSDTQQGYRREQVESFHRKACKLVKNMTTSSRQEMFCRNSEAHTLKFIHATS